MHLHLVTHILQDGKHILLHYNELKGYKWGGAASTTVLSICVCSFINDYSWH